ncbi:uncharacterized protein LOC121423000 [Lytechinus variegatus]|uniref:uncharacterized protein LOC121423000 n=1 Tax=Lytechinus variegatus TaxID=7654 RepID=UPI001BB2070E|nr:uncharacterized protein LOC121423000 [Lytechinus variegatus]
MKSQSVKENQDADMDLFEEEIFMDCEFQVPAEESPSASSFAVPPIFVPSIGRGVKRVLNPSDVPLPQAYYNQLEQKRKATHIGQAHPQPSHPGDGVPMAKPPRGKEKSSLQREQVAHPRARGRGRGRVIEKGFQEAKPSVLQVRGLGRTGLPDGNDDIEEGKARLMQMFLGRQSQFELDAQFNAQYDSSGSSIRSAPNFDLKNDKDFPDIISKVTKGMPFRSSGGGSLDENLRRRATCKGLKTRGYYNSSGDDGVSSSGDTGERQGARSSCDADIDTSCEPSTSLLRYRSSDESSSQALEGPNVLELVGLPSNLSKEDLGDLLMGCGNIIEMRLLRDNDSGACIGLAYVRMENEGACKLAVSSYHDMESPFSERYDGDAPQLSVRILPS